MERSPFDPWVVLLLTLAAAVVNGMALWLFKNAWIAIILCTLLFYGGAIRVCTTYKLFPRLMIKKEYLFRTLVLGMGSAIIVGLLIALAGSIFISKVLPSEVLNRCSEQIQQSGSLRFGILPFLLWVSLVLPVGEEMYWRGGLQGILRKPYRFGSTLIVSALCFTFYHLVTISFFLPPLAMIPFVISVFLGGLFLGWLTEHLGNIWAAAICHGLGVWGGTFYLIKRFLI